MDDGSPVCLMDERCTSAGPGRAPETLELSPFDAAEYLRDEEDARLYLQACIDEDPSDEAFIERAMASVERARTRWAMLACWCHTCRPVTMTDMRMVLCPDCGNKRCPKATNHRHACTGSNEPGQPGSVYA